jgi:hypothetical protein
MRSACFAIVAALSVLTTSGAAGPAADEQIIVRSATGSTETKERLPARPQTYRLAQGKKDSFEPPPDPPRRNRNREKLEPPPDPPKRGRERERERGWLELEPPPDPAFSAGVAPALDEPPPDPPLAIEIVFEPPPDPPRLGVPAVVEPPIDPPR